MAKGTRYFRAKEPETQARRAVHQPRVPPGRGPRCRGRWAPAHGGAPALPGSLWPWPARGQGGALRAVASQAGLAAPDSETESQQRHLRPPPRRAGLLAGGRPEQRAGPGLGDHGEGRWGREGGSLTRTQHTHVHIHTPYAQHTQPTLTQIQAHSTHSHT